MPEAGAVRVTVMYSPAPREVLEWLVTLEPGATVSQALQASGLPDSAPDLELRHASVGLWGRRARLEERLRDRDRVEVLRALKMDPKLARRERFRKQGSRAAGLFARRGGGAAPDKEPGPG